MLSVRALVALVVAACVVAPGAAFGPPTMARAAVGRRTAAPVVVMLQPDQVKARKPAPGFKNVPDLKARREAYAAKQAEGIDFSQVDPSTFTGVGLAAAFAAAAYAYKTYFLEG